MWGKSDVGGLQFFDELLESEGVAVGGVGAEQRMVEGVDLGEGVGCEFGRSRRGLAALTPSTAAEHSMPSDCGEVQAGGKGLQAERLRRRPPRSVKDLTERLRS